MDVAPSRLLIGMREVVGTEVDAYNVGRPENLFNGSYDSGLGLSLGEVISHQRRTNSKFRWMASSSVSGDAYL